MHRVLAGLLVAGAFSCAGVAGGAQGSGAGGEFLLGGDISALAEIEEHGGVFKTEGRTGDAVEIMSDHGCNCFRLRLFVEPTGRNVVVNDLAYTIALARRIKAAGGRLLLNFHYSDTWADPSHQRKPRAWEKLDFESLEKKVYEYTRDCIAGFSEAGVLPEMVQPGNEIAPGMLWPEGKLYGSAEPSRQWERFTRLLKAAARGINEASGSSRIKIVLHIHCGGDSAKTKWFFENIESHGVPYDMIGLSYYPWWHGSMEELRTNLRDIVLTFNKPVIVVETAYPFRPLNLSGERADDERTMRWPMTADGQKAFLNDLVRTVRETPKGLGVGVLWWYPESIPVKGLHIWNGGATALFDEGGNVLPAMSAFEGHGVPAEPATDRR